VISFVLSAFDSLGSYRDADAMVFAARVLPVVLAAQQQMGAITDAYLAALLGDMTGATPAAGGRLPEDLRGVPPAQVYRRPFVQTWTALSRGHDPVDSIGQGRTRLLSITETDLQLARTHAARGVMERGGVRFFKRRLGGSKNCALCIIASTQRYRVEKLMPIHPGCHCKPEPLPDGRDPGQVIDEQLLTEAHDAIARDLGTSDRGGRKPDYRNIIVTREHGEYGPLLAVRRHEFTAKKDLPSAPPDADPTP
jgi:hypothetical protein